MKVTGIIAEYNPFHQGHKYQIDYLRNHGSDVVVVAMSGDYVQRGTPAMADKYLRAKCALLEGADFVFEIPTVYCLSSAEGYARGGISLLNQLGFVDSLCFGSESGSLETLELFADLFATEPAPYLEKLLQLSKTGLSYPAAREAAALEYLNYEGISPLSSPNNILAIEYLKALKQTKSTITPVTIKRQGGGYHDRSLATDFASASAIRHHLRHHSLNSLPHHILPGATEDELAKYLASHKIVVLDDFSEMAYYSLRSNMAELHSIPDCNEDLANRMAKELKTFTSLSSYLSQVKTKQYTHSRISRCVFQCILGIQKSYTSVPLRLLGMRGDTFPHKPLSPIISNLGKDMKKSSYEEMVVLEKDILAADLYNYIYTKKGEPALPREYTASPIRL